MQEEGESKVNNLDDFIKGQKDCEAGEQAKQDQSDAYNRGYAAQYQHEQNRSWRLR